ncbi:MAG: FHA domain-containing protein [Thermoguttaceae bacterium]
MKLELVAAKKAEDVVVGEFPALLGQTSGSEAPRAVPTQGNYHCLISRVNDHLVVWDLGTGGGTYVNGVRVTNASLQSGDSLRLGGTDFSVRYQPSPKRYLHGVRS